MRKNIIVSVIFAFIILFIPHYSYSWTYTTRWDPANMGGWYTWDSYSHTEAGVTLSPPQPDGNTKTCRVLLPTGSQSAWGMQFGGASVSFPETDEVWAQFYLYYPSNFVFHAVMDKFSGWSWNGVSNNMIISFSYGRWQMMPQNDWPGFWQGFFPTESSVPNVQQTNHWYKINQHLKMNTPGKFDGVYEMWVDDQLVMSHNNVGYRASGDSGGFNKMRHLVVWGGGPSPPNDHTLTENTYVYYGTSIVSSEDIFNKKTGSNLTGKEPMPASKLIIK